MRSFIFAVVRSKWQWSKFSIREQFVTGCLPNYYWPNYSEHCLCRYFPPRMDTSASSIPYFAILAVASAFSSLLQQLSLLLIKPYNGSLLFSSYFFIPSSLIARSVSWFCLLFGHRVIWKWKCIQLVHRLQSSFIWIIPLLCNFHYFLTNQWMWGKCLSLLILYSD